MSVTSVSRQTDSNGYVDLDSVGTFEPEGNLLPPRRGWEVGDLRITYEGGYDTPAIDEADGNGDVPPDLQRAIEVTAHYMSTIDSGPNRPKDQYSDIVFDYVETPKALPSSVMTILERYKRAVLAP